jgi:DNA-binding transcriptional MerR regulator
MFSIGEFARYAQVSVRMLRHYDALGLLEPAYVDPVTGYRHYAADQLARINRLVALKELGFTLEQIGPILDARIGAEELRGMLTLRRAQVAAQIDADQERLAQIERRLRVIEKEGTMSELEFVEKALPPLRLAQLTDTVEDQSQIGLKIGPMFGRLTAELPRVGVSLAGPVVAWYDGDGVGDGTGVRIAAGFATTVESVPVAGVEVGDLAAAERSITVLHRGSMETIGETWQALGSHVAERGLDPYGPCREVYIESPMDDPDAWVTELQQPVR